MRGIFFFVLLYIVNAEDEQEFVDVTFRSDTSCRLNQGDSSFPCEFSVFALSYQETTAELSLASASDGNLACNEFRISRGLEGKVALAMRGQCSFYAKVSTTLKRRGPW